MLAPPVKFNDFAEATVISPLSEITPVPVEKVPDPVCVKSPLASVIPVNHVTIPADETSQLIVSIVRVFAPHPMVTAPVEVPVLIAVVKFELVLIELAAPEVVSPTVVRSPESANTMSPVPS